MLDLARYDIHGHERQPKDNNKTKQMSSASFPNELIDQCLSINSSDARDLPDDPGSLLQLILSVLEQCRDDEDGFPLSSSFLESHLPKQNQSLPVLMYQILKSGKDNPTSIVPSIQSTRNQASNTTEQTWWLGLQLIALVLTHPAMTAFEVHSVALQSMAFGGSSTRNSSSSQNGILPILILLLCTWALEQCHTQIIRRLQKVRYKRIQSLLLETIQLYQRQFLLPILLLETEPDNDPDDNQPMSIEKASRCPSRLWSVPLWLELIVPLGQSLWKDLPDTVRSPTSLFWPAVTVSTASHFLVRSNGDSYYYRLYHSATSLSLEPILGHPWRVAARSPSTRTSAMREDWLDWWTLERCSPPASDALEEDDDSSTSSSIFPPDDYEAIDTSWNELGMAILAVQAWQERPLVYRPCYQWNLWFPHVANLMNPDLHPNSNTPSLWIRRGIELLHDLLPLVPDRTLSLSHSFSIATMTTSISKTTPSPSSSPRRLPPHHPVGTFQLLLNSIVASASSTPPPSSSSSTNAMQLPPTMELVQLCRDLLAKYTPTSQVELILEHLLPSCPHPGLRPKLLDLLRPLVGVLLQEASHPPELGHRLKLELQRILGGLGDYCQRQAAGALTLHQADELIDQVEYYVSACALLHLGWKLPTPPSGKPLCHPSDLALGTSTATLQEFADMLRDQLQQWGTVVVVVGDQPQPVPDQFFRLNLLDMSIQQLLDLPQ